MPVTSGISQYQQPTGNSMNRNAEPSSLIGCRNPAREIVLPFSSFRYDENLGGNFPSYTVDVKTSQGTEFTPALLIGGKAVSTKLETIGLRRMCQL